MPRPAKESWPSAPATTAGSWGSSISTCASWRHEKNLTQRRQGAKKTGKLPANHANGRETRGEEFNHETDEIHETQGDTNRREQRKQRRRFEQIAFFLCYLCFLLFNSFR